jgi:hypothetical protein
MSSSSSALQLSMNLGFPKNFPSRFSVLPPTLNSQLRQILYQHTIHPSFGRQTLLISSGLDSILRGISLLLILWVGPAYLGLPLLIVLIISDDLYSWYNSWLYLSRHSPFTRIWPNIFLNIFLSKVFRWAMSNCVSVQVWCHRNQNL